jgi:hypothetical protein
LICGEECIVSNGELGMFLYTVYIEYVLAMWGRFQLYKNTESGRLVYKRTKLKFDKLAAVSILTYASENWTIIISPRLKMRWGPCPHSVARPRVADGGTASSYGG